ncbi:EthD domain-containing protein [Streptomyces sp. NPDC021093]|uniref:EthD domain-containing protein n=1 Tax=Streptomyces sp. NPDC021093 TaxID=3365112 RepID=UPI0037BDCADD
MIKLSIFLTRRADLSHEEFVDYWTQKHTPLLSGLPAGAVPVRRYVQLLPTGDEIPGISTADYDGVAEVWVDDIADAARWFTSDTYTTTVAADEENFLDRSRTRFLYATESTIFG